MSSILDSKLADSRNLYFLHIFDLIHAKYDFTCLFLEMLFLFPKLLFGKVLLNLLLFISQPQRIVETRLCFIPCFTGWR